MSSESEKSSKTAEKIKKLSQEQIISQFNQLRQEQKILVTKLSEVEQDLNEHRYYVYKTILIRIWALLPLMNN